MGKGDKKTRRGKIHRGTYGVRRPKNKNKVTAEVPKTKNAKKTKKAKA